MQGAIHPITPAMEPDDGATPALWRMRHEIAELVGCIEAAKAELHELQPQTLSKRKIPDASDELEAIVQETELAAGKVMDAAEEIETLAQKSDGKMAASLADIVTRLYEASSFQDITGQRITKVVGTLRQLEERLSRLAEAIGDTHIEAAAEIHRDENGEVIDAKALLHGPELPQAANAQDDIDAILASFDGS